MASTVSTASSAFPSGSTIPTSVDSEQDEAPTVRFTDVESLFETIKSTTGDILIVTHVSPSHFAAIERQRRRRFRFRRYDSNSRILVITIPTLLHEALHLQLHRRYERQTDRMGVWENWLPMGSTTYRAEQGHPGGDGGEGDSTGGPDPERAGINDWPTLVIEAGDSESLEGLHHDMRWWFRTSNHQVKIVLLAKFDHTPGHRAIVLEKWEEEPGGARPGATTTRYAAALHPILRQNITIAQNTTTNPVSYNVTRGALVLGFRLLFLRDPSPTEGDIVYSVQDLRNYAAQVWRSVPD